ncbi:MAG: hypothetical protein HY331_05440 [Chloroflexi bacterium]|nr:hypothetical protein [Chloroflexota bacterium]
MTTGAGRSASVDIGPAGGTITSPDGKLRVTFPAGALAASATVRVTPSTGNTPRPAFDWLTPSYDVDVRDAADQKVGPFAKLVAVEYTYADDEVRGLSLLSLSLYRFDETPQQWTPLPTTVDYFNHTMRAVTTHFSELSVWGTPFTAGGGFVNAFETDLFTGTASFSLPLEVTPGPNGMQPRLTLSYSSGSVEEMKSLKSRGSWVGVGWHLGLGSITYEPRTGKFFLKLNGVSDELLLEVVQNNLAYYRTKKDSFIRIQRVPITGRDWTWKNPFSWEAWAKDGTYYRFGGVDDTNPANTTKNGDQTDVGVDGSRHY